MQKIIATIGPITSEEKALINISKAGMDIARLNGSHANLLWHKRIIKRIQKILPFTPIIFDILGRKIRSGNLFDDIKFNKNDVVTLTINPRNTNKQKISISLGKLITKFEKKSSNHIIKCISEIFKRKIVKKNELILITYVGYPNNNYMNVLQTHYVRDLI